jgi:hypothetical protein
MQAVLFQPTAIAPSQMIKLAEDIIQREKHPETGTLAPS